MRILLGLVVIASGILVTLKSEWIYQNFGTIPFFEAKFHSAGGGRFGYKLIGILATFIGILIFTNLHTIILTKFANLFIPGSN